MSHLQLPFGNVFLLPNKALVTGIDGKTVADTTIVTTAAGLGRFFPLAVRFTPTTITALVTPPTVSVGTNSPNFNNILVATALTTLTTVNDFLAFQVTALTASVAASTAIKCRVSVGATGTAYVFACHLIGDYA